MGEHLIDGDFQSDKYPTTPRGLVPLKTSDKKAQPLLWLYAEGHREKDASFADDVQAALRLKGFDPTDLNVALAAARSAVLHVEREEADENNDFGDVGDTLDKCHAALRWLLALIAPTPPSPQSP